MNILYVITKANWGGAQRYVWDLMEAAIKEGHEPMLAYGEHGLLAERARAARIPLYPIEGLTRDLSTGNELAAFRELLALIEKTSPDVVHVNSSKGGLGLLAARLRNVPTILFTAHGWAFNEERPWWQRVVLRFIYFCTVILSKQTICVSKAVKHDIGWMLPGKLHVIYNGIDSPTFKSRDDARAALLPEHSDKTWLGMLTELHDNKRVEDAIDALAELKDEYPHTILVIIGAGEKRTELERRIQRRGLGDRVFLIGFKEHGAEYLSAFDIFVHPSKTEALAYSLIEAGYAGLPVVAARTGGIPEIITHGKTGLLVPPKNPYVLARTLRRLLDTPEEGKEFGARLQESVTQQFSKEKMVRETFALY